MYPNQNSFRRGSLYAASEFLAQPILPSKFSRRRMKRRRSLPSASERLSTSSTNFGHKHFQGNMCACKSTNLHFSSWNRHKTSHASDHTNKHCGRMPVTRSLPKRISFNKKSMLTAFAANIKDTIESNPQLRPSVCTVLVGVFFLMTGLTTLFVPYVKSQLHIATGIVFVVSALIVLFGGIVGVAFHHPNSPFCQERRRNNSTERGKSKKKKGKHFYCLHWNKSNSESEVFRRGNAINISNRKDEKFQHSSFHKNRKISKTDCSLSMIKKQQQLPYYHGNQDLIFLSATSTIPLSDLSASRNENKNSKKNKVGKQSGRGPLLDEEAADRSNYTGSSSIFPMKMSEKSNCLSSRKKYVSFQMSRDDEVVNTSFPKLHEKQLSSISKRSYCYENSADSNSFPAVTEEELSSFNNSIANTYFEIYQDPLLHRAITRLKFQCECEF